MSAKALVMFGMIIGSIIGGFIPSIFGVGIFSYWSAITSAIGALLGIWLGYKISN